MLLQVRKCPGCREERSAQEVLCGNCRWDLTQEPLRIGGQPDPSPEVFNSVSETRVCSNGHPVDSHDEICFTCGAGVVTESSNCNDESPEEHETIVDGWTVIQRLEGIEGLFESFIVERHGHRANLTLYFPGAHPELSIYEVFKKIPKGFVPEVLAQGTWECRRYLVTELISHPNLLDLHSTSLDLAALQQIVKSIGRILSSLSDNGLRHGNLCPENIFITNRDPLKLMVSGFHYSHLSAFDLDFVKQPISACYTAPEVIAGGISVASDWWSLGMVILELITKGACFEGINEKAFKIHVVTRGISLPKGIDPSIHLLLRGLLASDTDQRWQWNQVQSWLAGEHVEAPQDNRVEENSNGPALDFKDLSYTCPKAYALIAAEASNWEQAKDFFLRGVIATWLEERQADPKTIAGIRLAASIDSLHEDFRHSLALMWMNPNLPLIYKGDIITSAWMLQNPTQGYELIIGPLVAQLRQMNREMHLCDLHDREVRARERAKALEIELNEESFRLIALASSRFNLERQWAMHRKLYPGSDHGGLNSLMDRQKVIDEELMILLGAAIQQYQSAEEILSQAKAIATQSQVLTHDESNAREWFDVSRRDIYREIEARIANYSRCGIVRVDEWANDFRIERRISLPRALVLLSIPPESWQEPPRQQYFSTILEFFEKRTANLAQRGPLVRMLIGKSNSRVDLAGIVGKKSTATSILEHLISRVEAPVSFERIAFKADPDLEQRMRHLISHAKTYKRDTGIDSLYLGFPFLVMKDNSFDSASKKPRIAPILLWPIKIDMENRERISILFDCEREEVRLNPALTGLVGPEEAKRWEETANELLGRSGICVGDVIDAFGSLAAPRERMLCALPCKDYQLESGLRQVVCSAVLFHAEFLGQAIGEDLRHIRRESPIGTGLEAVLRVNKEPISMPPLPVEKNRSFTFEGDPSQEESVFRARQAPGLLIEGPPGTGKSQTIVNILGDCIGRNQTALVVCQKSAALEVLAKRLDAEGLHDRYFYITHVNKARTSVIQSLRTQTEEIVQSLSSRRLANLKRKREELIERIEKLEREIDGHHAAIYKVDEATGLCYRTLLGQLIDLEDQEIKLIDVPSLRNLLKNLDQKQLTIIEDACSPISGIWLKSSFEGNPLEKLKSFSPDRALLDEFSSDFFEFLNLERKREEYFQNSTAAFDVEDPVPHQEWIKAYDCLFKQSGWKYIASWIHLFPKNEQSTGVLIIERLEVVKQSLNSLDLKDHDHQLSPQLINLPLPTLKKWISWAKNATTQGSFFSRFNPRRYIHRKRIQKVLIGLHEESTDERIIQLQRAVDLELQLRPFRESAIECSCQLHLENHNSSPLILREVCMVVDHILGELYVAKTKIQGLHACPRQEEIASIIEKGLSAYQELILQYERAFERHKMRSQSLEALDKLSLFFTEDFFNFCRINIQNNHSSISELLPIAKAMPSLGAYQEFRLRIPNLSPEVLRIFAILRKKDNALREYPSVELERVIRRIIAREARLAWKDRIEQNLPILRLEHQELFQKIQALNDSISAIRKVNQEFLVSNTNLEGIGAPVEWANITRLRGPRACRLREIVDRGWDMGLGHLRPVWLMNPETASQLLPLRAGMFDVVIFDEASQIPIENALPALYRAKRSVISGDEKQMPPTNVFVKQVVDDDESCDLDDELDEIITDTEKEVLEDTWNRKEIKDCSDLLTLGKSVLPRSMLQIHYRSKYRELISFSNAAYYGSKLSIPVRHPDAVIQENRPIEMIRVDGVYANQTNRKEAERVVDFLAEQWATSDRPTIGVVTFNAKQADLIEDLLAERADQDVFFRQALGKEQERQENGEDMGFFVKNVENVQGDERDIIIFSSTFGKNEEGVFKRQFGLLGQAGGERRLNVAITRAKEKIILITSLPIKDISDNYAKNQSLNCPRDYLQAYFDYAAKLSDGTLDAARQALDNMSFKNVACDYPNFEKDGFIRSVASFIRSLGLKPSAIPDSDAFGLDFVIEDQQKRCYGIGIECDAHCHPIWDNARAREVWRPKVLRMGIPHVYRLTSYAWYHRREEEMERLKQALEEALGNALESECIQGFREGKSYERS